VAWSLTAGTACGGDHAAGPATPTCSTAQATQLTLSVGGYASLDPGADGGCVTIAANTSTIDSADLDTLRQVFDERLYPLDTTTFGGVSDID